MLELPETINKFKEIWLRINLAERILLISHLDPDVDAIASLGVMMELLKINHKKYLAFAQDKILDQYSLPNESEIIAKKDELSQKIAELFNEGQDLGDNFLSPLDIIIIMDCGSIERTALSAELIAFKELSPRGLIIEIDHHVPLKSYADIEVKIPLASTTEVLYYFLKNNNLEINRALANNLLAGILTDTGNFLYPSVSSDTLKISSELLSSGAQFPKILNNTWRNKSFLEMKIWGLALDNLRINKKYNLAFSVLPYKDLREIKNKYGAWSNEIFSDIVGFLSNLSEANVVLLLREEELFKIKGSFRVGGEESSVDVSRLANFLGGGGHQKASGFFIKGNIIKEKNIFKII